MPRTSEQGGHERWQIPSLPAATSPPAPTSAPAAVTRSMLARPSICRRAPPVATASGRRSAAATAPTIPTPTGTNASAIGRHDGPRPLDRLDQLRPRQRAGSPLQRDQRAQAPLPLRPRKGREPNRLPEDLQGGGEAGAREGDRQGFRVPQGQVRLHGGGGLRGGTGRGLQNDRHHRL